MFSFCFSIFLCISIFFAGVFRLFRRCLRFLRCIFEGVLLILAVRQGPQHMGSVVHWFSMAVCGPVRRVMGCTPNRTRHVETVHLGPRAMKKRRSSVLYIAVGSFVSTAGCKGCTNFAPCSSLLVEVLLYTSDA